MRISPLTERKKVLSYLVKMIWTLPLFLHVEKSGKTPINGEERYVSDYKAEERF